MNNSKAKNQFKYESLKRLYRKWFKKEPAAPGHNWIQALFAKVYGTYTVTVYRVPGCGYNIFVQMNNDVRHLEVAE
jgi:hypothetical protein